MQIFLKDVNQLPYVKIISDSLGLYKDSKIINIEKKKLSLNKQHITYIDYFSKTFKLLQGEFKRQNKQNKQYKTNITILVENDSYNTSYNDHVSGLFAAEKIRNLRGRDAAA